jgi:hypothetical protein
MDPGILQEKHSSSLLDDGEDTQACPKKFPDLFRTTNGKDAIL